VAPPSFCDILMMSISDRERLRREMRARRRALSPEQRAQAARRFALLVNRARLLRAGRQIAVYLAQGAEADLHWVIDAARRRGCGLYLPVIADYRAHRMEFHLFDAASTLRPNRYGIPEPERRAPTPVARLDVVFAPLVAFDLRGSRLGSGAGFYDRALQRRRRDRKWRRPRIIGVGYECQRVAHLESRPWDVGLDAVLTERGLYRIAQLKRKPE
jgi:5-formyltetrahydrofolate cyclo-ligase